MQARQRITIEAIPHEIPFLQHFIINNNSQLFDEIFLKKINKKLFPAKKLIPI